MKQIKAWPYLVAILAVAFATVGTLAYLMVNLPPGPVIHSKCVGDEFRAYWIESNYASMQVLYDNSCIETPYVSE